MNKPKHQLQVALADCMQASLCGLTEIRAKKLHKTIAKAAKKLAEKYALLLAKERKGSKKEVLVTAPVALEKAALRVTKATAKRPGATARAPQKKAPGLALTEA